jgi:secreted Zn-dependent insulinase-like peptidase
MNSTLKLIVSLQNLNFSEDDFNNFEESVKIEIQNENNLLPKKRAFQDFLQIISKFYIDKENFLQHLEKNKKIENHNILNKEGLKLRLLCYGNINLTDSVLIYKQITKKINNIKNQSLISDSASENINKNQNKNILFNRTNLQTGYSLPQGVFIFRRGLTDNHNHDHAILNIYEIGKSSIENIFNSIIIKSIVGNIYFTELRIKNQLGYSTKGRLVEKNNLLYFSISVQGSRFPPEIMDEKIENVVFLMREKINSIKSKKLKTLKKKIMRMLSKRDKSLRDRAERIWWELTSGRKYFNFQFIVKKYFEIIKKQNKNHIVEFYDNIFTKNLKKLSIQQYSKNVNVNSDNEGLKNIIRGNVTLDYIPQLIQNLDFLKYI